MHAGIAQLVERLPCKEIVGGSNPSTGPNQLDITRCPLVKILLISLAAGSCMAGSLLVGAMTGWHLFIKKFSPPNL